MFITYACMQDCVRCTPEPIFDPVSCIRVRTAGGRPLNFWIRSWPGPCPAEAVLQKLADTACIRVCKGAN